MSAVQEVQRLSDLDGAPKAAEVLFGYEGDNYVIDLTAAQQKELSNFLKPYIKVARGAEDAEEAPAPAARRVVKPAASGKAVRVVKSTTKATVTRKATGTATPRASASGVDMAALREWAAGEGIQLGSRGRVPAEVIDGFKASLKSSAPKTVKTVKKVVRKSAK